MTIKRNIIVTGGSRGIGAAISKKFHFDGHNVVAIYFGNGEKAKELQDKYGILIDKWDVSDFDECATGVERIKEQFGGGIDILINNAGITADAMMHKMGIDYWKKVIDTNLSSCFNMSKAVIQDMRNEKFGRIINISSINALSGQLGQTNYAASKAGIIGFTKSLALEVAAKGITVNAVAPGYIKTEMTDAVPEKVMDHIIGTIPVQRIGEPDEIARVVEFLASERSGFITGETISVNGGHYMQ